MSSRIMKDGNMHKLILPVLASAAFAFAAPALGQDAKPLAGQSITV
ncbi:sugar ABC transporter substrate-binding protein, partial [Rhizobium johnstonii]